MQRQFQKTAHIVERTIRDHHVLVPMKTGPARLDALYTLNETAAFIWKHLTPGSTVEDLTARLVMEYETDPETARTDIRKIIDGLLTVGAIEICQEL